MGTAMMSNNLILNNNVEPKLVGAANGLSIGIAAFTRSLGPVSAGFLYGWSTDNGMSFPFNFFFSFLFAAILMLISAVHVHIEMQRSPVKLAN